MALALTALLLSVPVGNALAQEWKALRDSGALAERYDGLLVPREASAAAAAELVNAARLELYKKRAAETGAPVDQVGRVYFKENLPQLPAGTWLLLEDGTLVQK